jgi:hypothetical protein
MNFGILKNAFQCVLLNFLIPMMFHLYFFHQIKGYLMQKSIQQMLASASIVLLTACGGGGGGTPVAGTAEGYWTGTTSTGYNAAVVVLENGETWGLYTSGNIVYGALYGTSTGTGNTFSASGSDFNLLNWAVSQGSLSGTVVPQSTIKATSNYGTTVNLTYSNSYNTPATQAAIAGTYTVKGISATSNADNVAMTISSTGVLSVPGVGCNAAGTVTPRSSGKNVYNISVTFTGNNCALGNGGTASGIFILDGTLATSLALTPNKQDGFIAFGRKNS